MPRLPGALARVVKTWFGRLAAMLVVGALCLAPVAPSAGAEPRGILVVAAENFYANVTAQIAGDHVRLTSILSDPNVDPHEYETNSTDAQSIANARLVIQNGLGYDDFIDHLAKASPNKNRTIIVVAQLTGHKQGDNPHLWYQPGTMPEVARAVSGYLAGIDPANARFYHERTGLFIQSLRPLNDKVASLRRRFRHAPVACTEPVFGYMAEAIGLDVQTPEEFQKAIEEGEDPPARAIATMEDQLRAHKVKVLIYNLQTVTPITTRIQQLAKQAGVPIIGVSETLPPGKSYQEWMVSQLSALDTALTTGKPPAR
jgi:zinc/manganese transport system substrate-binding protein